MHRTDQLVFFMALITLATEISQAGVLRRTVQNFATSGSVRKLSAFHDAMCQQAKKTALELGTPDPKNQTYTAELRTKKEFDGNDVVSQLAAFMYWKQLLEHRTYRLTALAAQHPASKIFINTTEHNTELFDDSGLRAITIVQDPCNRIILQSIATMSAEHGKIWIEENNQETEFNN